MKTTLSLALALIMAAPVALTGCDRNVSETTHTATDANGNTRQETKTVREDAAGNVTVDKEKKTVTTNNP